MSNGIVCGGYYQLRDKIYVVEQISKGTDEVLLRDFSTHEKFIVRYEIFSRSYRRVWKVAGVAKLLNRHPRTLRKYETNELIEKPFQVPDLGKRMVRFYSHSDIEMIREVASGQHRGRRRKDGRITNNMVPSLVELNNFLNGKKG